MENVETVLEMITETPSDSEVTPFQCFSWCFLRSPTGVFAFGLFATDIFVNAGQVVTGGLSPYFLSVCKPNYTGTECRFNHQFIAHGNICTGNPVVVENARRSFPSKDASLSVYSAVYLTVSRMCQNENPSSSSVSLMFSDTCFLKWE